MNIAFFGTSEFVGALQKARFLRRLIVAGIKPALVVTAPDARGRDGKAPGAVISAAREFGIPVLQPVTLDGCSKELKAQDIELSLVVAYGKILPPDVLAVPKFSSLNIHPSLLPRWRGTTPIQSAILAGDAATGVTIIQMDSEMDHGPIVASRKFPLGERAWTAPELSDALTDLGVELFIEILEPWSAGKITPQPQDHTAAIYSRILKKEDGHVDWAKPAVAIERQVRAFQPWPGAYTFWQRDGNAIRLTIEKAEVVERQMTNAEGNGRVFERAGALCIQAVNGVLQVRQLKPEGGRSMPGEDFLRGRQDIIGAVLQ